MLHYLNYVLPLIEGASVMITVAFIVFRFPFLRQPLFHNEQHNPAGRVFLLLFFSVLAIYGTHSGMIVSLEHDLRAVPWTVLDIALQDNEAIINFRDLVIVSAALVGGFRVGLIVGLVAALERYQLGGFTALACALASVLSGVLAGMVQRFFVTRITPLIASITGSIAVLLQMLLILLLSPSFDDALLIVKQIVLPMWLITASGCYLFIYVMQIIDSDRAKHLAYFNAQIEPHFLMNTLNAIRSLTRSDPKKARDYITHLGEFMQETQRYAREDCVTINDELGQAQRYMDFQQLRFPQKINYDITHIDPTLLATKLPPRTLLTLLENALTHGWQGRRDEILQITLCLYATKQDKQHKVVLEVSDNGKGIDKKQQATLGKQPLLSRHQGGGHALYNLTQMMQLALGRQARLQFINKADIDMGNKEQTGTIVRLVLPDLLNKIKADPKIGKS